MAAIEQINYLQDGERANAQVLNRPTKEIVEKVNQKFQELDTALNAAGGFPTALGFTVEEGKVGAGVTNGKAVFFKKDDQTIQLAKSDTPAESKFIGIYNKASKGAGFEHRVVTFGIADVPESLQAEIGTVYYLSTNGDLTKDKTNGSVVVGMGIAQNKILVSNIVQPKPDLGYAEAKMQKGKKEYAIKYIPGRTMFYVEGILVAPADITATDGSNVTIKFEPKAGDILAAVVIQ